MQSLNKDLQETIWSGTVAASKPLKNFREWNLYSDAATAIQTMDGRNVLTYEALHRQLDATPLKLTGRIALVIEQTAAAELAMLMLSVMHCGGAACPLDPKLPSDHLRSALRQLRCRLLIVTSGGRVAIDAAEAEEIPVLEIIPNSVQCGTFDWPSLPKGLIEADVKKDSGDEALLLRTSGTTAMPKIVPITLNNLHHGALTIAESLQLTRRDICLNAMPFFHIGGISCNLLAVLSVGSAVKCMPTFDAACFVSQFGEEPKPTWYYAVPTMHKAILLYLQAGPMNTSLAFNLRFARSGAAHISHNDAVELSAALGCPVLPTSSMTECMPVNSTALSWKLEKKDTVGAPIGVSLRIAAEDGSAMAYGEQGEVLIKGPALTKGYEGIGYEETFVDGWFRTGDLGKIDRDGHVYLLGRKREMVKRGGEQISLHEVDKVVSSHDAVQTCVSFAVPNDFWGEEVAAAVVLKTGFSKDVVDHIIKAAEEILENYKVPRQLLVVKENQLPKTATGKYIRNGLAKHLRVEAVDNSAARSLARMGARAMKGRGAPQPSKALTGLRGILMIWVMFHHIGQFENRIVKQIQAFSVSMPIFVFLVGFQLGVSTTEALEFRELPDFYASRIGQSQAVAIISLLFSYINVFIRFPMQNRSMPLDRLWRNTRFALLTGFNHHNSVTWFQMVTTVCCVAFPLIDWVLRRNLTAMRLRLIAVCTCLWSTVQTPLLLIHAWLTKPFVLYFPLLWLPYFTCGLSAAYIFKSASESKPHWRRWGDLTDALSVFWMLVMVAVCFDRCTTFYDILNFRCAGDEAGDEIFNVWLQMVRLGRFTSSIGYFLGYCRMSFPVICLWLYGLAVGQGRTAKVLSVPVLVQHFAPISFPVYLMHMQVAWYVHFALKGIEGLPPKTLWADPIPLNWPETFLAAFLTMALSWVLNQYVVGPVSPWVVSAHRRIFTCCRRGKPLRIASTGNPTEEVLLVIRQLTGTKTIPEARLDEIGLDSFGATALLSMLQPSFSRASLLAQTAFYELGTIGALVNYLTESATADDKKKKDN